jgi:hypothetical protein
MIKMYFVKAESWQVFAISIGCFITGYTIDHYTKGAFANFIATLIASLGIGSWIYFVGISLYSKLPPSVKMSYRLFNINIFVIYFCLLFLVLESSDLNISIGEIGILDFIIYPFILPLYFYFWYALVYIIYFISKALVSIEKNSEATFSKYIITYLLIALFPIGIWYIQPKIRAIYFKTINAG